MRTCSKALASGLQKAWLVGVIVALALPVAAEASEGTHESGSAATAMTHRMMLFAIQVGVILFAARIGGVVFKAIRLPGALGELAAGMLIGPHALGGVSFYGFAAGLFPPQGGFEISPELNGLAALAAIVLLFMVGLETDIRLLLRYALAGGFVGMGGIVFSLLLGSVAMVVFHAALFGSSFGVFDSQTLFLGIILCATSAGITARILSEHRKLDSPEGVTILSAAVIDDVIGIILLAVVMGMVSASKSSGIDWAHVGLIGVKAVGVWLVATILGLAASRKISFLLKLFGQRMTVAVMALGLALILAGLFEGAGLAMIVGAYVMGVSLSRSDISHMVREKLQQIYSLLIPVFFCVMGMRIDLGAMGSPRVVAFGLIYAGLALASKVFGCGLPALFANFNLRGALRVGFGMAPRCEVALIIASIGLAIGGLDQSLFAAVVIMVLVNSMVAPIGLAYLFRSSKPGTRKTLTTRSEGRRKIVFEFSSREMTEFLVNQLTAVFEAEGFFVHLTNRERSLYQLRKDAAVIDLQCNGMHLSFDCNENDIPLVNVAMYEAVAELERAIRGLRQPLDADQFSTRLQEGAASAGSLSLHLRDYLTPALVKPELQGESKWDIIDELLDVLASNGKVHDVNSARQAVRTRENSMSTGLQHGVAIPHGRSDAVDRLVCAVGTKPDGVEFESMDGEPSTIFILSLSPQQKPAPHVLFMSTVSQVLNTPGRPERILAARTGEELFEAFVAPVTAAEMAPAKPARFELGDYVTPDVVIPRMKARTRDEVIDELLDVLVAAGLLPNRQAAREAILEREKQMPTGLQDGVAIPHARTDTVKRLVCAIGVQPEGIDFASLDDEPSRIFILALTPASGGAGPYLQFAGAIMSVLDSAGRQRILEADSQAALHRVITARTN